MRRLARAAVLLGATLLVMALAASLALRTYATARLQRAKASFEANVGSLDFTNYAPDPVGARSERRALAARRGTEPRSR